MKLELKRKYLKDGYTIGALSVDGVFFCDTLEDTVRTEKIAGKTAIPAGTYRVIMSMSKRFKKVMPELLNVPGFAGVRIHSGNTAADTEGCILVGRNTAPGTVTESRKYAEKLYAAIAAAKDVTIAIG